MLPTERRKPQDYNPRLMVLFGKPKSGKSSIVAGIDDNLVIDLEDGYRALEVMVLGAKCVDDLARIRAALAAKAKETGARPYRFITIDNATRLEEMALPYAASKYRRTSMGQGWGLRRGADGSLARGADGRPVADPKADVRTLPNGAGYFYLREAMKELLRMFQPYCDTLILVCHTKDKQIRLNGEEATHMEVDLAGKLGDIVCGEADAVGFVERDGRCTYVNFEGGGDAIREARCPHLRGRRVKCIESDEDGAMKVDCSALFIDAEP